MAVRGCSLSSLQISDIASCLKVVRACWLFEVCQCLVDIALTGGPADVVNQWYYVARGVSWGNLTLVLFLCESPAKLYLVILVHQWIGLIAHVTLATQAQIGCGLVLVGLALLGLCWAIRLFLTFKPLKLLMIVEVVCSVFLCCALMPLGGNRFFGITDATSFQDARSAIASMFQWAIFIALVGVVFMWSGTSVTRYAFRRVGDPGGEATLIQERQEEEQEEGYEFVLNEMDAIAEHDRESTEADFLEESASPPPQVQGNAGVKASELKIIVAFAASGAVVRTYSSPDAAYLTGRLIKQDLASTLGAPASRQLLLLDGEKVRDHVYILAIATSSTVRVEVIVKQKPAPRRPERISTPTNPWGIEPDLICEWSSELSITADSSSDVSSDTPAVGHAFPIALCIL